MLELLLAEAAVWSTPLAIAGVGLLVLILLLVIWRVGRAHRQPVRAYDREQRQLAAFRRRLASEVTSPPPSPPAAPASARRTRAKSGGGRQSRMIDRAALPVPEARRVESARGSCRP